MMPALRAAAYHHKLPILLWRVTPPKTPFRLLIPLLQSQPHVTTITHNHLLRCVTFTQLAILHVRNYNHLLHSYTGWLLSYQLLSQIITHLTSSHFPCLSPIETSLVEQLLNNTSRELLLNNWLLRQSSSSYITLNRTSVTVACCTVRTATTSQVKAVLRHSRKHEGHVIFRYSWCVWSHRGCAEILFSGWCLETGWITSVA
jgi:hypothetical protein